MKVTDLKEQKNNKDRFSVLVDGKYSFSISANDLLAAKLSVGSELDDGDVARFKQQSSDSLLLARTYEKCLRRPHSEKEIRDYLRQKQASVELAESIVEKCRHKGILNDDYFAERWVAHRRNSGKSNRYIESELRAKGVSPELVSKHVGGTDEAQLQHMIEKKRTKYGDEKKLIAYLQRQGFRYSDIAEALKNGAD